MHDFIKTKALEKGYSICYHCLTKDEYFGLSGQCSECHKPLPKQDVLKSFLLALEVINEFIKNYDELINQNVRNQICDHLSTIIMEIKKSNNFPKKERINSLRVLLPNIGIIGSKKKHVGIEVVKGNATIILDKGYSGYYEDILYSLTIVFLSFKYIMKYFNEIWGEHFYKL